MSSTLDPAVESAPNPSPPSDPIVTFPLEEPLLRSRRKGGRAAGSLPYFIAGEENRMVAFVAQADVSLFEYGNPLLLVGPSGVGKTSIALHLAARHAVALSKDGSPARVYYVPAVDFARQYAEAVGAKDMPPFRAELDEAAILLVEDVHLISDKGPAQEELALRIETRTREGRLTLVTCRRLPSEIRGMRPMLVSRTLPGLTVPIRPPAGHARRLLLGELALHHGLEVKSDLLDLLATALDPKLPTRSLDAAIRQLDLWCRMNESDPTIEGIQSAIEVAGGGEEISLKGITVVVARHFRLKTADLRSSSRKQLNVRARSLAMYLARHLTSKSMHQIGQYFGGRDHTTVLHAIRKTESLLQQDADLRQAADEVGEKLAV